MTRVGSANIHSVIQIQKKEKKERENFFALYGENS